MTWDRMRYRSLVDELVESCRDGEGQLGPRRARGGVWNVNADHLPEELPDQAAANDLLRRLSPDDRDVLAGLLAGEFVGGVFTTLRVLHEAEVDPFDQAEEGTPFMDLMGRLQGSDWPEETS